MTGMTRTMPEQIFPYRKLF